jgi:DNA-binding NtrC family response regulator
MNRHLLFVDDQWCRPEDQATLRAAFGGLLRRDPAYTFHYETAEVSPGRYGVAPVLNRLGRLPNVAAVILDLLFGDGAAPLGLDILAAIRSKYPLLPVVVMTTLGRDPRMIEQAMKVGATEYMVKTPTLRQLEEVLATYVEEGGENSDYAIWGNSEPVRRMRAEIARVAVSGLRRVLVVGESGAGKELVARAIHRQGSGREGPFVAKNCAYASVELLDSDLFGHERGAFTGAERPLVGLIEAADKGVLFLDEISSMPHELQGKLLRVLETGSFTRLGTRESRASSFQLISATNLDPEDLVRTGCLREDLYYRLSEYVIRVPPLRERNGDVAILARLFLQRLREKGESGSPGAFPAERFTAAALAALAAYSWPGNVRQLRNVVAQSSVRAREPEIGPEHMQASIGTAARLPAPDRLHPESAAGRTSTLPEDPSTWPDIRLRCELELAVAAKERIRAYKGQQWKAEFMRLMYPDCRARSAKGFQDLVRRLTSGPWGSERVAQDPELRQLLGLLLDSQKGRGE